MGGTQFDHGEWDAGAHVNFLRSNGDASSGYTADLVERLHRSHRELYDALNELLRCAATPDDWSAPANAAIAKAEGRT